MCKKGGHHSLRGYFLSPQSRHCHWLMSGGTSQNRATLWTNLETVTISDTASCSSTLDRSPCTVLYSSVLYRTVYCNLGHNFLQLYSGQITLFVGKCPDLAESTLYPSTPRLLPIWKKSRSLSQHLDIIQRAVAALSVSSHISIGHWQYSPWFFTITIKPVQLPG